MIKINNIQELSLLLENKKVFIFDFDGTIADTETLHWAAYNECLSEFDVVLTETHINRYIGNSEIEIYRMLKQDFKIKFDDDSFFNKRIEIYLDLIEKQGLKPYKFFNDLLNKYKNVGFYILSSQKIKIIRDILSLWNLDSAFDKIISAAEGDISKEDVLKNAYDYFGAHTNEIVLFEDTNRNLALAKENGILAVGVQHMYNKSILRDCDAIIEGNDNLDG